MEIKNCWAVIFNFNFIINGGPLALIECIRSELDGPQSNGRHTPHTKK